MNRFPTHQVTKADIRDDAVLTLVWKALRTLTTRDDFLLEHDASERSITHRLGVYLGDQFPQYDVDCEYNRRGKDGAPKRIVTQASPGKCVFPDVIVHRRGIDRENLISIEVKKNTSIGMDADWAREKLHAFADEDNFRFQYCLLVTVRIGEAPGFEVERV